MNTPQNIFGISVLIVFGLIVSIMMKFGFKIWNNLEPSDSRVELSIEPNQINDLQSKISENKRVIDDYDQTSVFQQTLMKNISNFKNSHDISIYSIPKVHINANQNTKSTTIQIQITGNFENQLLLLENFEKELSHIPLKSCAYKVEKKKKKKKLIGTYIFQYKSSNSI